MLVYSCWDEAPDNRPSIDELVSKFSKLSKVSTIMLLISYVSFTHYNCYLRCYYSRMCGIRALHVCGICALYVCNMCLARVKFVSLHVYNLCGNWQTSQNKKYGCIHSLYWNTGLSYFPLWTSLCVYL